MISILLALLALLANGENDTFARDIIANCTPVVRPFEFVGCEDRDSLPDEDAAYAGIIWMVGIPVPQTGP